MRASDPVAFRVESTTVETTVVTEECLDLLLLDGPLGRPIYSSGRQRCSGRTWSTVIAAPTSPGQKRKHRPVDALFLLR